MDVGVTDSRAEDSPTATALNFDEWVEGRVAALLRFAYVVTGSQHAAEDAVQTALTRACEKWSRIRRADDPDAYVRRMIVNAHVSGWRGWGRRQVAVADVRAHAPGADHAEMVAGADAVWRMCLELPRRQRAALALRYYEDLDYPEIARVLGCAEATARSHVHRALTTLRARMDRQEGTDG